MSDAAFIPHAELVPARAPGAPARARTMLVLHGAFGSGQNFRLFTRRLAESLPGWAFWLADVRGHGRSRGAAPPHDLAAAAHDLVRLAQARNIAVHGVMGHSLGGKLALVYAALRPGELDEVWVLDSQPGPQSALGSPTWAVLELLRAHAGTYPERAAFVAALRAAGQPRAVAEWLAMSLDRTSDGYRLGLELEVVGALLEDYFARDLWPEIERGDARRALHVVAAERSEVLGPSDRARLAALAPRGVRVHVLPEAGHWLHVDAPDALRALLAGAL